MSVQAISWVLENSQARLGDRCVLIAIANHADSRGNNAWPSVRTIAREARLSTRQVQHALKRLCQIGELEVQWGAGPHGTNRYCLKQVSQ